MNTAILLLLKINTCFLPLQCSSIMKALQGSQGADRLAFPGTEGAGHQKAHHPSWETGLTLTELSEYSCLAVLCAVIFFTLKVYFKVWIRFYGVWLLVISLTSCSFVSLQKQNLQQFPVQWFYNLIFQLEAGCAGINSETWRWSIGLRNWRTWALMTSITWQKNLRQNWNSCK